MKTYTCSGCSHIYTESIAKLNHSYTGKVTKNATCAATGVKTYTCSKCSHQYTEDIAKLNHTWGNWWMPDLPNPYNTGTQMRTCSVCKQSETQTVPKVQASGAVYYKPNNCTPLSGDQNTFSMRPYCVFWKDGKLYVQCFTINDYTKDARLDTLVYLRVKNNTNEIAYITNVSLNGDVIEAKTYDVWQFVISGVTNVTLGDISIEYSVNGDWV